MDNIYETFGDYTATGIDRYPSQGARSEGRVVVRNNVDRDEVTLSWTAQKTGNKNHIVVKGRDKSLVQSPDLRKVIDDWVKKMEVTTDALTTAASQSGVSSGKKDHEPKVPHYTLEQLRAAQQKAWSEEDHIAPEAQGQASPAPVAKPTGTPQNGNTDTAPVVLASSVEAILPLRETGNKQIKPNPRRKMRTINIELIAAVRTLVCERLGTEVKEVTDASMRSEGLLAARNRISWLLMKKFKQGGEAVAEAAGFSTLPAMSACLCTFHKSVLGDPQLAQELEKYGKEITGQFLDSLSSNGVGKPSGTEIVADHTPVSTQSNQHQAIVLFTLHRLGIKPEILGQFFGLSADGVKLSVGRTFVEWPMDECTGVLIAIARVADKIGLDENGRPKPKTVHS